MLWLLLLKCSLLLHLELGGVVSVAGARLGLSGRPAHRLALVARFCEAGIVGSPRRLSRRPGRPPKRQAEPNFNLRAPWPWPLTRWEQSRAQAMMDDAARSSCCTAQPTVKTWRRWGMLGGSVDSRCRRCCHDCCFCPACSGRVTRTLPPPLSALTGTLWHHPNLRCPCRGLRLPAQHACYAAGHSGQSTRQPRAWGKDGAYRPSSVTANGIMGVTLALDLKLPAVISATWQHGWSDAEIQQVGTTHWQGIESI